VDADVAIVGAGPVGLLLAAELRAWDVRTVVLERSPEPDTRLRAPTITERTIEALERHELLDRLVDETERHRARHDASAQALPTDLRVSGTRMLPIRQDLVERILEEHVRALGADLHRGCEVVRLAAGEGGVDLGIRGAGGADARLSVGFAVGCDGARSTVRDAAGIAFPGTGATLTGYQAEVTVAEPDKLHRGWRRTPTGIVAYELCPSRVVSIEFTGPPADRAASVTLEEVQASVRRTSATDVTLTGARSLTRFTDNARIAASYRRGRVLLAGDAAHVHAPFGGQGLNLGMQDAANLGWKLAAAVHGWAPRGLLDTYERERRPVAERVLEAVQAASALLDTDRRMTPVYELFGELRQLEAVRRYLHEKTAMVHLRYDTGAPGGGPLGCAPRGLLIRTAEGATDWARLLRPGRGLLLVSPSCDEAVPQVAEPWRDRLDIVAGELVHTSDDDAGRAGLDDVAALLLRPDGHAVWLAGGDGGHRPASLEDVLARWFGPALQLQCAGAGHAPALDAKGPRC
jgi:rifampicin monooxygenase